MSFIPSFHWVPVHSPAAKTSSFLRTVTSLVEKKWSPIPLKTESSDIIVWNCDTFLGLDKISARHKEFSLCFPGRMTQSKLSFEKFQVLSFFYSKPCHHPQGSGTIDATTRLRKWNWREVKQIANH